MAAKNTPMNELYKSRPENMGGALLVGFALCVVVGWTIVFITERPTALDWFAVTVVMLVVASWTAFIVDEAIWQICGIETCEYDDEWIYVTKKKLVRWKWRISWNKISNVSEYSPHPLWKAITQITMAGKPQEKIVISYGMGRKLRCGTNLTERQCQEVMKTIENRILAEKK